MYGIAAYTFLNVCEKKSSVSVKYTKRDAHKRKSVPFYAFRRIWTVSQKKTRHSP